jgi:hypothetical protein
MSWFKHYNLAHEGQTIAQLWAENDTECIAFYWTVLEMISRWEDPENRGTWTGNLSIFRSKLGMKKQRSYRNLTKISDRFCLALSWISDESFQLSVPKWLELQENRGGKNLAKNEQNPDRGKRLEVRISKTHKRTVAKKSEELPELAKIWNENCGALRKVLVPNSSRQKKIEEVFPKLTAEQWLQAIHSVAKSDFCNGGGDRGWVANFDWFLKNYHKVLEGHYDNRTKPTQSKPNIFIP